MFGQQRPRQQRRVEFAAIAEVLRVVLFAAQIGCIGRGLAPLGFTRPVAFPQFGKGLGVGDVPDRLTDGRASDRLRIGRHGQALARAHEEQAAAVLRHSKVGGVQHLVVGLDVVAAFLECLDDFLQELAVLPDRQPFDVLEHEILRLQLHN